MLRRRLIVVLIGLGVVSGAVAQEPPGDVPASQPEQEMPTSAPAGEQAASDQIDWDQMSVDDLLAYAEGLLESGRAGRANEAMVVLSLVSQKDPGNLEAKLLLGVAFEAQGNVRRAREFYFEVLKSEPSNFRANLNMGRSWVRARWWRQAMSYLEAALEVARQEDLATVKTLLAMTYQGLFERQKAIDAAEVAVRLEPDNLEARHVLIAVYMSQEERDQAVAHARLLVESAARKMAEDPGNLQVLNNLHGAHALRLQVLGDYHRTFYEQMADGRPTDRLISGYETKAAQALQQIIEERVLLIDLTRTRAYHDLLGLAEKLTEYAPDDVDAALQYGLLLRSTGKYEKALEVLRVVLERDPNNAQAQPLVAELEQRLGGAPATQPQGVEDTP